MIPIPNPTSSSIPIETAAGDPLPELPLALVDPPPGIAAFLEQEGVPHRVVRAIDEGRGLGRFVLTAARPPTTADRARLDAGQILVDVSDLPRAGRAALGYDPVAVPLENRSAIAEWEIEGVRVRERVDRATDRRAEARAWVVGVLRRRVLDAGGIWLRAGVHPWPHTATFGFRVDLDEPYPEDYLRFAAARDRLGWADRVTHFVCTSAYAGIPRATRDLARPDLDVQSHGHHHHVYAAAEPNRRNLARARDELARLGIEVRGFAGPGGRWNPGLDAALRELGHEYGSEFQVVADDRPAFPWIGDRFSDRLQIPTHPVCEGIFHEAGHADGGAVTRHLVATLRRKVVRGEPAFLYGHPERRLARHLDTLDELDAALRALGDEGHRVRAATMTRFAAWWRERLAAVAAARVFRGPRPGTWRVRLAEPGAGAGTPIGWELADDPARPDRFVRGPGETGREGGGGTGFLEVELDPGRMEAVRIVVESESESEVGGSAPARPVWPRERTTPRQWLREWLDWEKATPPEDLIAWDGRPVARLKAGLRRRQIRAERRAARAGGAKR